jgi:hypothetical protein
MNLACRTFGRNEEIDPRLIFLERASARLFLVKHGEMDVGEAFDGLVAGLQCSCSRKTVERWERDYPPVRRQNKRAA